MRTRSLLACVLLLGGCLRHHPVVPEPARAPARDSLFDVDRNRGTTSAAERSAGKGMFALFAPDVVYLRAGAPAVYGIAGVRALFAANPASASSRASWLPLGGGVSDDLRSAYTFGIAARPDTSEGDPIRFERYIAYWERTTALTWRITAYAEVGGPPAGDPRLTLEQTTPPVLSLPRPRMETAAQVRAADSLFSDVAYRLGLAFAFSDAVAPTGAVFGTPQLVVGPDAVRELYTDQSGATSLAWHPVYASAAGSRDLGFTVGEYIVTARGPSGAAVQRFGKYITVWKRQKDGKWKFVIDGGSPTK